MYRTVAQLDSLTNLLAAWFPMVFARVRLPSASVLGADVFALRMRAGGGTATRRGVLVVGGTHARELMNPDAIAELAIDLLSSYLNGTDIRYGGRTWSAADVKLIVEAMDIWLVPCINPDGRTHVLTVDDLWRKNRRDNPGTSCDGVDLNRNADFVWGVAQGQTSCSPCAETYCGPSAFSEPEGRNVKHILDTERIVAFVDVHSYSELVLYPWGHAPTQSTDPSRRFTGLATGTCTASIPSGYAEYMPARDVQRFQTVSSRIVTDVAAVRGRTYTAQTSLALYPTTGTQSDYAYSRHIANPSLQKTYGFTFETGPWAGNVRDSFHPADPTLIKRDAKAAILALLQQSVCAIDLIGTTAFDGRAELATLRKVRDEHLAASAAGRQWIALFERVQFALMLALRHDADLLALGADVIQSVARMLADDDAVLDDELAKRANEFLSRLRAAVTIRTLQSDLALVRTRMAEVRGHGTPRVIASLVRRRPGAAVAGSSRSSAGRTTKSAAGRTARSVAKAARPAAAKRPATGKATRKTGRS